MAKDQTQVFFRKDYGGKIDIQTHETEILTLEARIALALMEKWALVAAMPDGEDSAGRSKLRSMTADEVSQFSCDAAQRAMDQFRARSWTKEIPTAQELLERLGKGDGKNEYVLEII